MSQTVRELREQQVQQPPVDRSQEQPHRRGPVAGREAARVAWRIIKDWLEAQLALVSAELADLEQVFLPYAQNGAGVTLYEALKAGQFNGLALPSTRS